MNRDSLRRPFQIQRRDGTTARQMREAPNGSVYVWPNAAIDYPRRLARFIGCDDLRIVSPSWLSNGRCRDAHPAGLVIDHAAELTQEQAEEAELIWMRIDP